MLKIILIRELQAHIKSRQVLITFLISLLLFLLSAFVMKKEYRQQVEDYYQRSSLNQKWMTKDITRIDRPVPSLTSLVTGLTGRMGNSAKLVRIKSPEITESVGDNVVSVLFPAVDLLFIAGIVMSLLALFNAYNTICGEKENRTLALILSNSVARHTILLGKWLAGYLALTIPFLISFLISILVLIISGSIRFNISDGLSIMLIGFIVFVTIGVFHLLGIFISTRIHSSRMAAFWGLLIWFSLVLIWPNVSVELAKNLQKVPAPQFLARQERLIRTDEYQRMQEACSRLVNKQKTDRKKQLMADRIMCNGYMYIKERMFKLQKEADNKLKTQVNLGKWLSSISPYSNFVFAMTDMAGTGVASEYHFRQSVMSFDGQYFGYFHDRLLKEEQYWWSPENAPGFKYRFLSVSERLFIVLPQIGLLLFWGVLLFVGAFVSFLKYDVR